MAHNKIASQMFVEALRPHTLKETILLPRVRAELEGFVEQHNIPQHILLAGVQGIGKTCVTRILSEGYEVLELNASLDNGIDVVREQIMPFITSVSLFEKDKKPYKIIVLEECDFASANFFGSLRPLLEKFHSKIRVIFNCNYIDKVPKPIQSRCNIIQLEALNKDEEVWLTNAYIERVKQILDYLKITYTDENVRTFVTSNYPDFRSIIKKIQSLHNRQATELTPDMLSQTFDCSQLFQLITTKPDAWNNYKALVADWSTKADEAILEIGKNFAEYLHTINPSLDYKIPTIIIEIANHQNMLATAIDKFIVLESLVFKLQYIIWQQL